MTQHRVTEKDLDARTGLCAVCGPVTLWSRGFYVDGTQKLACSNALKRKDLRRRPYVVHKRDTCELCGFVPIDMCQLDVHHLDGNRDNNELSNLQTLCANCHRLQPRFKAWTDDPTVVEMYRKGSTYPEIAAAIGKSEGMVGWILKRNQEPRRNGTPRTA